MTKTSVQNVRNPLPASVKLALGRLQWSLSESSPMEYKSITAMQQLREARATAKDAATGGGGEGEVSPFDIEGMIALLTENATTSSKEVKYMAQIATSLLLLGHGYMDEAHDLVLSLSWRGDLPYAYGPPVNLEDDLVQTLACYAHCLVHRKEGPYDSEFNMTGFQNSAYWAGNTMRNLDGVEALPLAEIRQGILELVDSEDAQQFVEKKMSGIFGEWDPRVLTELCREVVTASISNEKDEEEINHPMKEFAERAALMELRTILMFLLHKMGFDMSIDNETKEEEEEAHSK